VSLTKFDGITYPFFGLIEKPYAISYDLTKIYVIRRKDSHRETVDDKSLQGDYFARLAQMNQRLKFDTTCANLQQLIISKVKWGMDASAKPFDLTQQEFVRATSRQIIKTRGSHVFVKGITYPFTMPTNETLEFEKSDELFMTLVFINDEWHPFEITNELKNIKSISI
jgi:hypothetical protein